MGIDQARKNTDKTFQIHLRGRNREHQRQVHQDCCPSMHHSSHSPVVPWNGWSLALPVPAPWLPVVMHLVLCRTCHSSHCCWGSRMCTLCRPSWCSARRPVRGNCRLTRHKYGSMLRLPLHSRSNQVWCISLGTPPALLLPWPPPRPSQSHPRSAHAAASPGAC